MTTMFDAKPGFRSGFVSLLGFTNAGKSTLINRFVTGAPAIVSKHPQTTRIHQRCISTDESRQIVFVDTPGLFKPRRRLDRAMRIDSVSPSEEINRLMESPRCVALVVSARRKLGPCAASASAGHAPSRSSSSQFFMNMAAMERPLDFSRQAETAESTPPDRATMTSAVFSVDGLPFACIVHR